MTVGGNPEQPADQPGNGSVSHAYRFDDNGNLIQQNTEKHHTWDHADRMTGYRVQASDTGPASVEARYLYGTDGCG